MKHDLYQFESLLGSRTHEKLATETTKLVDHLGYESLFYAPLIGANSPSAVFHDELLVEANQLASNEILSTYPASWVIRYQKANFVKSDPVLSAAINGNLPILWRQVPSVAGAHPIFDEARQHGLANGLSIPIHGARGEKALLSVSSSENPEKKIMHEATVLGQVYLAALYLHEAVHALNYSVKINIAAPQLSEREKECLLWASKGKTAWEIGLILRISTHTVTFHINNSKRKLGSANRHQAIATAISNKLICP